uniref:AlNc14C159G7730 protein n=1 Tax=Albugo laibachii Nc14 TaxID=890382 RepID=F0WMP2_9STRA|nr:AlNc14C159G7730 [Albugo laibachii Nc14]|eukprot:CCA22576.1 AlNc14C159G7730 [Albugo laibachii Nc14]
MRENDAIIERSIDSHGAHMREKDEFIERLINEHSAQRREKDALIERIISHQNAKEADEKDKEKGVGSFEKVRDLENAPRSVAGSSAFGNSRNAYSMC